ncbi:MAG: CarD family transcriptional regulator [Bifidobacteriaceae bacterium]|jgi:CarD family transcriptional regulator|nr:CarD family transcriptional regulator [Bifidobacteriaceae bacterium]
MQYKVGDSVVYPKHGAATVTKIEERVIRNARKTYLTLEIAVDKMTIQVPADNLKTIGVRDIIDKNGVEIVFDILSNDPPDTNMTWTKRFKENVEKSSTGNLFDVAEVIKDLVYRGDTKAISAGEKRMLHRSMIVLVTELAISLDENEEEVKRIVTEKLDVPIDYFD